MSDNGAGDAIKLEPGDLLTVEETARLLRLTISGVMRLKDREGLPCYRVGSRLLFDRREIGMWLAPRRLDVVKQ